MEMTKCPDNPTPTTDTCDTPGDDSQWTPLSVFFPVKPRSHYMGGREGEREGGREGCSSLLATALGALLCPQAPVTPHLYSTCSIRAM